MTKKVVHFDIEIDVEPDVAMSFAKQQLNALAVAVGKLKTTNPDASRISVSIGQFIVTFKPSNTQKGST